MADPKHSIRSHGVQASIFVNFTRDGKQFYSTTLQRRYKDNNGEWQNSSNFSGTQLLHAASIAQEAAQWCRSNPLNNQADIAEEEAEQPEQQAA